MKKIVTFLVTMVTVIVLAGCSAGGSAATTAATAVESALAEPATTSSVAATSAADVQAENAATHAAAEDYTVDQSAAVPITFNGDTINAEGSGVTVAGSTVTITAAGTYRLSGTLDDGQVIVDTQDKETVWLILDGASLSSSTSAPLYIAGAEKAVIVLAEGSENTLSDAASYVFELTEVDEPNAAIFSKADLTLTGGGSLVVNGNLLDGVSSKDGLIIAGGNITVTAVDDGIRGKDYLVVEDGLLTVSAGGDGLKADNAEDASLGYVAVSGGIVQVTAGGDALNAQTDVSISGGTFALVSGGGSARRVDESVSAKGIKGAVSVTIDSGAFTIDAADDAIHSNGSVTINGGQFNLASGDDGAHADQSLAINGGEITIAKSYEGLESAVITINAGTIHVTASDDGVNVAGGMDGSGMMPGGRPGGGGDAFTYTGDYYLYVNGGYLSVDARGDGVDVNGAVEMTGGLVLVNGPTEQMNGALDYDGGFKISGGSLVAVGSSGMAQAPGAGSSQLSLLVYLSAAQPAGTLVHIQNSAGEDVLTFAPAKSFQSIAFSSPELVEGETYTVYTGGSSSGTAADGLYQGGTYTPGSQAGSAALSGVTTLLGSGGGMMGGGRRRP